METDEGIGWNQGAKRIMKESWATVCEEIILARPRLHFKQSSKTEYQIVPSLFNLYVGYHGNGKGFWVTPWYQKDVLMDTHPKIMVKYIFSSDVLVILNAIHKNEYNLSTISIKIMIGCHGNGRREWVVSPKHATMKA